MASIRLGLRRAGLILTLCWALAACASDTSSVDPDGVTLSTARLIEELTYHEQWLAEVASAGVTIKKSMSNRVGVIGIVCTSSEPFLLYSWQKDLARDPVDHDSQFLGLQPLAVRGVLPERGLELTGSLTSLDTQHGIAVGVLSKEIAVLSLRENTADVIQIGAGVLLPRARPVVRVVGSECLIAYSLEYGHSQTVQVLRKKGNGLSGVAVPGHHPVAIVRLPRLAALSASWSSDIGTGVYLSLLPDAAETEVKVHKLKVDASASYTSLMAVDSPGGGFWLVARLRGDRTLFQNYDSDAVLRSEQAIDGLTPVSTYGGVALIDRRSGRLLRARFNDGLSLSALVELGGAWPLVKRVYFLSGPAQRCLLLGGQ